MVMKSMIKMNEMAKSAAVLTGLSESDCREKLKKIIERIKVSRVGKVLSWTMPVPANLAEIINNQKRSVAELKSIDVPEELIDEFLNTWGSAQCDNSYFSDQLLFYMRCEYMSKGCGRDELGFSRYIFLEKHVPKFLKWVNEEKQ